MSKGVRTVVAGFAVLVAGASMSACGGGMGRRGQRSELSDRCAPAERAVVKAVSEKLDLEKQGFLRNAYEVQSKTGVWFVSAELVIGTSKEDRKRPGKILTWATESPTATQFNALDQEARKYSTWPDTTNLRVTTDGVYPSRQCVDHDRPKVGGLLGGGGGPFGD